MVPEDDTNECRKWALANVVRSPIVGDVYTTWHDNHTCDWNVHAVGGLRENDKRILMLTDGFNCTINPREWDDLVREGKLRFTGKNHLYATLNET